MYSKNLQCVKGSVSCRVEGVGLFYASQQKYSWGTIIYIVLRANVIHMT